MKTFSALLVALTFAVFTVQSSAASQWELATIEKITSDTLGAIQIKLDKKSSSPCSSKHILLLPYSKGKLNPMLTRAMFAYSTGEKLNISGSGQCRGEFEVVGDISKS